MLCAHALSSSNYLQVPEQITPRMATLGNKFITFVECRVLWLSNNYKFFKYTKLTSFRYVVVGSCSLYYFPLDGVWSVGVFEIPYMFAQFSTVLFSLVFK